MSPEDRVKARPTVLILHSMLDETERIRALLERQPADLRVAHPQLENQTATNAFPITSKWSLVRGERPKVYRPKVYVWGG